MIARVLCAAALLLAAACATISARDADIFERPEAYVEQDVTLCGYIRADGEEHNIWIDRNAWELRADNDPNVRLGLEPAANASLSSKHDRRACVTGEVIRCDEENICAHGSAPYAIRVTR